MLTMGEVLEVTDDEQLAQTILRDYSNVFASGKFVDKATFDVEEGDIVLGHLNDREKALYTLACRYKDEIVCFFKNVPKDQSGNVMLTSLGQEYVQGLFSKAKATLQLHREGIVKRIQIPQDTAAIVQGKNFTIISKTIPESQITVHVVMSVPSTAEIIGECISESIH